MDPNAKTQVVERLRQSQNVLVTVSDNPSVDQLCSAIGLTLMMNKLGKHATAVFSGQIPSIIEFIKPEETLEQNTDSLRDFIIALDKSKADKLRYKVEEDVVKIFITPYRTSLSEADLKFSQGDFNVDTVVALGVDNRDHIDKAITAHGRIFHDATVIGVMAGQSAIDVGSINWQEAEASSLSEMLVSISEAFQSGLIDNQMATAFLTGMVSETQRFSNEKTTPKVMTMAAQLMASGANQQLIANNLEIKPPAPQGSNEATETNNNNADDQPAEPNPPINSGEGVIELHDEHFYENGSDSQSPKPDQIQIDEEGTLKIADSQHNLEQAAETPKASESQEENKIPTPPPLPEIKKDQRVGDYLSEPPAPSREDTTTSEGMAEADNNYDPLNVIPQASIPPPPIPTLPGHNIPNIEPPTEEDVSSINNAKISEIQSSLSPFSGDNLNNQQQLSPSQADIPSDNQPTTVVDNTAANSQNMSQFTSDENQFTVDENAVDKPPIVPPPLTPMPLPNQEDIDELDGGAKNNSQLPPVPGLN